MSQLNYADRQLETALTAMFEQELTENRSTMRYWPAVSDRLGEQVSRRPWEYVMNAINRPRMPFNARHIYAAGSALVVVIAMLLLLLFLNTDDGTDSQSVPADLPEMPVPETIEDSAPLGLLESSDPGDPSASLDPFEELSAVVDDEFTGAADIRAIAERRYEAFRLRDWDTYLESCRPISREATTLSDLESKYTTSFPNINSAADLRLEVGNITLLSPIDAIVELQIYEFDEFKYTSSLLWQNVDGNWYSSACSNSG